MGSVGEDFAEMKQQGKIKRSKNRTQTQELLKEKGIDFTEHNDGAHLIIKTLEHTFDLWPGTGKYLNRSTHRYGRGVFSLLREIGL